MKKYLSCVSLCLAIAISFSAGKTVFAQQLKQRQQNIKEQKLKNGLRVFLVEDHSTPVVAVDITYDVGARNEVKGRMGFAHLFEHMMFKGSENVGAGEHFYQILKSGGQMNGNTSFDATLYFEYLPANQLEMALFLEADRMRSLAITKENLDNQRNAVQEERRQYVDNKPYGRAEEAHQLLTYDSFPYKRTVYGTMEDLNAASVEDVAQFFKTYYAPNNAVLVIVGDFNSKDALAMVNKYFGNIPQQPAPPKLTVVEPVQTSERRQTINDPLAKLAEIRIAYKTVAGNEPDYAALNILSAILTSGQSSRLYQKMVKEKELVTGINSGIREQRAYSPLIITTLVRPGKKTEDAEAVIYEEINRLMNEPVTDAELTKVKNLFQRSYVNSLQSALRRAQEIGTNTIFYNDPNLVYNAMNNYYAVTKEDIQRVARKYLQPTSRSVVITLPAPPVNSNKAGE